MHGRILMIDPFGNLMTDISAETLAACAPCRIRYRGRAVRMVSSYGEGRPRELVALMDSSGYLELAVRDGSAARQYRARRGDHVVLARTT